ncbi:MAG: hypothetical protein MSS92_11310 [Lachnospiraceae bacterium]|nr:hypothetical protein [Lachnospiraceae bacterium]
MANHNSNKIRQYRKPININLGMIFFGVIFVYMIICVFMYFTTKRVAGYQVRTGSLYVENIYTGLALRKEVVVDSSYAGYLNYYVREGTRIGAGKMVCTIDEGGRLQDIIEEQSMGENSLSEADLEELRSDIMDYKGNFDIRSFSSVYDFKHSIESTVYKQANANILDNLDKLNRSGESGLINVCNSPTSGIVVYSYDGYEDFEPSMITEDILKKTDYEKKQLLSNELVSPGEPVYKLITSEDWSLIIKTDPERAELLLEKEYIQVKFLKNQYTSWAKVSTLTNKDADTFVQLTFNNSMISFCTERFVDVELILEEERGLKVPNSAIVEKEFYLVPEEFVSKSGESGEQGVLKEIYDENGNQLNQFVPVSIYNKENGYYYVDSPELKTGDRLRKLDSMAMHTISQLGSLVGVYNKNKGYADFKQIQILYQNEEYSIIRSNTEYGLIEYDYIVLDAQTVDENEFLN